MLVVLCVGVLTAEWVSFDCSESLFTITGSRSNETDIRFTLDGYEQKTVTEDGAAYTALSYWNEGEFLDVGKPALPRFSRLLAIPSHGDVFVELTNVQSHQVEDILVYPRQPLQSESAPQRESFTIDQAFYSSANIFPQSSLEVGEPAIMRDYRVVLVTINPFQYNPHTRTLSVITSADISLVCSGSGGINTKETIAAPSKVFENYYRSTILNYDQVRTREETKQPHYLFIYPNNNSLLQTLQVLTDWKHQMGYKVTLASTMETGTTDIQIQNYIQDAYDNWDNRPDFVCLVGDAGGSINIPTHHISNGYGDQFYALLEGNDILADLFVGRLSISSTFDLQTIISKIFNYEKTPYMLDTDWYENTLLVGDPSTSGQSCVDTKLAIKDMMMQHNPEMGYTEAYTGNYVNTIANTINDGSLYFNYRGYYGMSGWNVSNINSLSNGFKLPVAVFLTCGVGNFEGTSDCRSEAFLKAGTPSAPYGAIAAIGTVTSSTHTCFNNCVDAGIFYGIFADEIFHMGGALNRGKLNLYTSYPGNPSGQVTNFSYWNNLMGDPGMHLWTGVPKAITVDYPTSVPEGTNQIDFSVTDTNGAAVEDAWVTIVKGDDEIFATGYTDTNGSLTLAIPTDQLGDVTVTVTHHNKIPHLGSFSIGESDYFVNYSAIDINDDNSGTSSGNGNQQPNPGETIELGIALTNFGSAAVQGVSATLSTTHPMVQITDDQEDYGAIAVGATAQSDDDFDLVLDAGLRGDEVIPLVLTISDDAGHSWPQPLQLAIAGPYLSYQSYNVLDANGRLDPGETADLVISLDNIGEFVASGITATISCDNADITIDDNSGYIGSITPGASGSNTADHFTLTAATQILNGSQVPLQISLSGDGGFAQELQCILEVGETTVTDPLGPDGYGYYCYDDDDILYTQAPVYNWIEIDPALGGSGTDLNLNDYGDMGATATVSIPFTFNFYGENYSELTVCSNGWVSPGTNASKSYMNWPVPGAGGPSPMIAVFWDDLTTGTNGNVCSYFDPLSHAFIIEWSRMRNDYNNDEETFQLIIYDNNYYPSPTGDNNMKFQYKDFHNVDQGHYSGYSVSHGAYATVGLESHNGLDGIQYTCNNLYPIAAKQLADETALYFTGPPIPLQAPFITIGSQIFDDTAGNGNGQIDYHETIDMYLNLNNMGYETAHNVQATISCTDPALSFGSTTAAYGAITGGASQLNATAFTFTVADDVEDEYTVLCNVEVTADEGTWQMVLPLVLHAPELTVSSLFINDGDNNILDPGETAEIFLDITNSGSAAAYNINGLLSCSDPLLTINTANYTFGLLPADATITGIFSITSDFTAQVGYGFDLSLALSGDWNYASTQLVSIIVGLNIEDFEDDDGGYTHDGANDCWEWGEPTFGSGPAAAHSGSKLWATSLDGNFSNSADCSLITVPLTLPYNDPTLTFWHWFDFGNAPWDGGNCKVSVDNGVTWELVFPDGGYPGTLGSTNPLGDEPGYVDIQTQWEQVTVPLDDFAGDTILFKWHLGTTSVVEHPGWYIDDVEIAASSGGTTPGYLAGTVALDGGSGAVEDVTIAAGTFVGHPDATGTYNLVVLPGVYTVVASLDGYQTVEIPNVTISENQTTNLDITLPEMQQLPAPQNCTATAVANDVEVSWIMTSETRRETRFSAAKVADNTRALTGYRVYRNGSLATELTDPALTQWDDTDLTPDDYDYFVIAIYDEGQSAASNTASITVTLPSPLNLTAVSLGPAQPDVQLSWDAPTNARSLSSYRVYRDDVVIADLQETSYTDASLPSGTYVYHVTAMYSGSYESDASSSATVQHTPAASAVLPAITSLIGNRPNPFNPQTAISFGLVKPGHVVIDVYNAKGQHVCTLADDEYSAGYHQLTWNGEDANHKPVSSGLYFYSMQTEKHRQIRKMMLIK
jgi:hypothetical protein